MSSSDALAQNVATNLAFGCGEAGPFIAAGVSLLFGLFSPSEQAPPTAKQIQDMLDRAVTDLEQWHTAQEVRAIAGDIQTFFADLQKEMVPDPSVQTWKDCVDDLRNKFSYSNFKLAADLRQLVAPDVLQAGKFVDFNQDAVLKAIVAAVSAQIAASKAIYVSAQRIYETVGPSAGPSGPLNRADDRDAQTYMKWGIDEFANLTSLLFGAAGDTPWSSKPVGKQLPIWGTITPGEWMQSLDAGAGATKAFLANGPDGSIKVYGGDSPESCTGLLWTSHAAKSGNVGPSYLVYQPDGNLCVYDLSLAGSSVGSAHGPLLWQSGPGSIPVQPSSVVLLYPPPDGAITSFDRNPMGDPSAMPLWSEFLRDSPLPPRPSTFYTRIPDMSMLIAQWPTLAATLQPQFASALSDQNLPVLGGDVASYADAHGWATTIEQLLAYRQLTRMAALSLVTPYQGRTVEYAGDPYEPDTIYQGADGYQFTDALDSSNSCRIDDDYEDDLSQYPSATHQDEVQTAWDAAFSKISAHLNDASTWQSYYDLAATWRVKYREFLNQVVDDAPDQGRLRISSWSHTAAPAGSLWAMADTVTYAASYRRAYKNDMSLRSAWSVPVKVAGANPVIMGFDRLGIPDDATEVVVWRQVTQKDGVTVNEAFLTPQIIVSDLDWPATSFTDTAGLPYAAESLAVAEEVTAAAPKT